MKSFLKYVLATFTGIWLSFLLIFFIIAGIAGSAISSSQKGDKKEIKEGLLHLKLDYPIHERTSNSPFENFDFNSFSPQFNPGLNDLLSIIDHATNHSSIKGIYMDIKYIPANLSTITEIRNALSEFKKSGKPIYAYNEFYAQNSYYLCSVADSIFIHPHGSLIFKGLHSEVTFLKGILNKVGIDMQVFRGPGNEYKSAIEPFTRQSMSDSNKAQTRHYVQTTWDHMLEKIGSSRNLKAHTLDSLADHFRLRPGQWYRESKLMDDLLYKDEFIKKLKTAINVSPEEKIKLISLSRYYTNWRMNKELKASNSKNKIAVVYATGEMMPENTNNDPDVMAADQICQSLKESREDSTIKAVVIRINSGGGSALAAELIWREIDLTRKEKPVIASLSDYAASGGYYIATAANKIYSQPLTLTGSIGVFALFPNAEELLNEKLNITFDGVGTNQYSNLFSIHKPLDEKDKALIQESINYTYHLFLDRVSKGRKMSTEHVKKISGGRIWSGKDAINKKMIDEFGNLETVIKEASKQANINNYQVVNYPKSEIPIKSLIKNFGRTRLMTNNPALNELNKLVKLLDHQKSLDIMQTRLPYVIKIQ